MPLYRLSDLQEYFAGRAEADPALLDAMRENGVTCFWPVISPGGWLLLCERPGLRRERVGRGDVVSIPAHFAADALSYAIALGVFDVACTKLDPPAGGAFAGELGERVALAFMAEADRRREAEPDALLDTKELAVAAVDGALVGLEAKWRAIGGAPLCATWRCGGCHRPLLPDGRCTCESAG